MSYYYFTTAIIAMSYIYIQVLQKARKETEGEIQYNKRM